MAPLLAMANTIRFIRPNEADNKRVQGAVVIAGTPCKGDALHRPPHLASSQPMRFMRF